MTVRRPPMSRSENMARVKNADTEPERAVRHILWHAGFRYRKNVKTLPGKPDIYLGKYRLAIFIHGCFWHQHPGCAKATIPKTNSAFWREKLYKNVERDAENRERLTAAGIFVLTLWECEVKQMVADRLYEQQFLQRIRDIIAERSCR